MKKFLPFIALAMFLVITTTTKAQVQVRYLDEVFTDVQVDTTILYAQNIYFGDTTNGGAGTPRPLFMDVYRPVGDVATNRPVVLLSHNGSFLPEAATAQPPLNFCFKNRKDSSLVELCHRFARRGYVAISFSYRLGWNPVSTNQEVRTATIIQAVYRAMQDAKSLVRYLKNDFATGNQWGVDTGKIVIGGTNSGAYVALAASALNDTSELSAPKFVGTGGQFIKQDTLGDFDGFNGVKCFNNYPGISSRFQCALTLGGAVGDTSWIQPGETPILAFHGVNETLTPYNTAVVTTSTGQPVIEVSGPGDFMPFVEALGNNNAFTPNNFADGPPNRNGGGVQTAPVEGLYPFYGAAFEPWNWYSCNMIINPSATKTRANLYIDTIMGYASPRLYKLLIDPTYTGPVGINEVMSAIEMSIFPNPATSELNVSINPEQNPISEVRILDVTGRTVTAFNNLNAYNKSINVNDLTNGIYFVNLKLTDGTAATQKITIQ